METQGSGHTMQLSWDIVMNIGKFMCNYAEQNAILLPGSIPTHKRDDIKLLPSSDSKKVHNTHFIHIPSSMKCWQWKTLVNLAN